jgi:hypothetical protein
MKTSLKPDCKYWLMTLTSLRRGFWRECGIFCHTYSGRRGAEICFHCLFVLISDVQPPPWPVLSAWSGSPLVSAWLTVSLWSRHSVAGCWGHPCQPPCQRLILETFFISDAFYSNLISHMISCMQLILNIKFLSYFRCEENHHTYKYYY